jgi:hypothetical protein
VISLRDSGSESGTIFAVFLRTFWHLSCFERIQKRSTSCAV